MGRKAIILDRDGIINKAIVLNGKPYSPTNLSQVEFVDGIRQLLRCLSHNYYILVATNQPEVSRGNITLQDVNKINDYLAAYLPIEDFFVCPHQIEDNCDCRKPKTGLLLQAQEKYNLDFRHCWVIGDRWSDIEAGDSVGCKTIFVDYGYDEQRPKNPKYVVKSVLEIKSIIELEDFDFGY